MVDAMNKDDERPPLVEKDWMPQAMLIVGCIIIPVLVCYTCITCFFRHNRRKRLAAE